MKSTGHYQVKQVLMRATYLNRLPQDHHQSCCRLEGVRESAQSNGGRVPVQSSLSKWIDDQGLSLGEGRRSPAGPGIVRRDSKLPPEVVVFPSLIWLSPGTVIFWELGHLSQMELVVVQHLMPALYRVLCGNVEMYSRPKFYDSMIYLRHRSIVVNEILPLSMKD